MTFQSRSHKSSVNVGRQAARVVFPLVVLGLAAAACGGGPAHSSSGGHPSNNAHPASQTTAPASHPSSTSPGSVSPTTTAAAPTTTSPTGSLTGAPVGTNVDPVTPGAVQPPAGGAVPSGFEPASVTFVSTGTGYVLGEAGGVTSLVRTTNGGASWASVTPPPAAYVTSFNAKSTAAAQVSEVRFSDELDGWAFGPSLFATHDGARTWQQVNLGGTVVSLEAAGGYVDVVVSPCAPQTTCTGPLRLEQAPASGGEFSTVLAGPPVRNAAINSQDLSLHAPVGFVLLGYTESGAAYRPAFYATGNLGNPAGWNSFPDPCAAAKNGFLSSFIAPDTTNLYTLCGGDAAMGSSDKYVVKTNDGRSTLVGKAPYPGDAGTLTATPLDDLVLSTASGGSWLDRSVTGGASWSTAAFYGDGGFGFNDLGFTTDTQGVVVHGQPYLGGPTEPALLMTRDAGATWQVVPIG